jgi:signal transduction histidine kinase
MELLKQPQPEKRQKMISQHNEDLILINDIAAAMSGTLDLDLILDLTLTRVMSYLNVEAGEILLCEDGSDILRLVHHRGQEAEAIWGHEHCQCKECLLENFSASNQPFTTTTVDGHCCQFHQQALDAGFHFWASIPLTAQHKLIGVMNVISQRERQLDPHEIELLNTIGTWAGNAINNATVHHHALRLAVLEERERIGMDLHDGIIQSIFAVGLALDFARGSLRDNLDASQALEKIEQAIEGLNSTIRDLRAYILDLQPRQLRDEESLMHGLQRLVDEFQINSTIQATLTGPENELPSFHKAHAKALFHICQESLANIAKHAQARQAKINLWTTKERVLLEVVDNGKGFNPEQIGATLGHGLSNMLLRARKVGGDVEIISAPGEGTTVLAWVPRYQS